MQLKPIIYFQNQAASLKFTMDELKVFAAHNHEYVDKESGVKIKLHFLIGGNVKETLFRLS